MHELIFHMRFFKILIRPIKLPKKDFLPIKTHEVSFIAYLKIKGFDWREAFSDHFDWSNRNYKRAFRKSKFVHNY